MWRSGTFLGRKEPRLKSFLYLCTATGADAVRAVSDAFWTVRLRVSGFIPQRRPAL